MIFVIRDDDTCGYTDPAELLACYQDIWNQIPVSIAVTPFRIPGNSEGVPETVKHMVDPIPLSGNKEIISLLREQLAAGRISVALHGYNHIRQHGLPEYIGGTDLANKTVEGKAYLEQLLSCPVSTFVPPNNGLSRAGLAAVVNAGMNVSGVPSFLRRSERKPQIGNIIHYARQKYWQVKNKIHYPYVFNLNDHKELAYYSLTIASTKESLETAFSKVSRARGVFVLATHYYAFNDRIRSGERIRDVLMYFLEKAQHMDNTKFLTFDDVWKLPPGHSYDH